MRAGESGDMTVVVDGIRSDVYYAPLLHSGWSMGIVVPTERLLTPAIAYGAIIIFLILLGVLLAGAIMLLASLGLFGAIDFIR